MTKTCSGCKLSFEISNFGIARREKDGLLRQCKACISAARRDWYQKNREAVLARQAAYSKKNPEKTREWARKAQSKGRKIYAARALAKYHANKEQFSAAYKARYRDDPEFREKAKAAAAERRKEKRDLINAQTRKWRSKNPDRVRAKWDEWAAKNPEAARIAAILGQQRRRARVRGLPDRVSAADWRAVQTAYGHACAYCFTTTARLTVDHILPISRGGTNEIDNLAPACGRCNSSKSARTPLEFLAGIPALHCS